jgi:ABC-type lipoprotein release transport system permease subunit
MTVGVAALHAASMVFNGYYKYIQGLIAQATPDVTILKYEQDQRIGKSAISANESRWLIERLRRIPEVAGGLEAVQDTQTVEIRYGDIQVTRLIKIVGLGKGYGACPIRILEPYTSKLVSGAKMVPMVVTSDTFPTLKEGSQVKIQTESNFIDAIVVGVPTTGVMPLSMIALPMDQATRLLGQEPFPDSVFVRLRDGEVNKNACKRVQDGIKADAPARFIVLFWEDMFDKIFGVLAAFKFLLLGMFSAILVMGAIFTYAAFEIVVTRRRRGSSTLVALGLLPARARSIFHLLAIATGAVAAVLGVVLSFPLVWGLNLLPVSPILAASGLANIPISASWIEVAMFICVSCIFSWISARLSTRCLLRLDPADEMRR